MRFADVSGGLAKALEGKVASAEGEKGDLNVDVNEILSAFGADESGLERNKTEADNLTRFLKAPEEECEEIEFEAPESEPEDEQTPKKAKKESAAKESSKPKKQEKTKQEKTKQEKTEKQEPKSERPSPERTRAENKGKLIARMAEDPRAATKQHTREAKQRQKETPKQRRMKAERRDAQPPRPKRPTKQPVRRHFALGTHEADQQAAVRQQIKAEQKRADRRAERATFEAKPKESRQQETERALMWKETFEAFDEMLARGGHGWADHVFEEEVGREEQDGITEALLADGNRCRGAQEDGTRCLRRPPEGELYCREHRTT